MQGSTGTGGVTETQGDIARIVETQRHANARVIAGSLTTLTALSSVMTFAFFSDRAISLFLAAVAVAMAVAYAFARRGAVSVSVSLLVCCVFVEHVGAVAISGGLGPMPFIAPVVILVVAATTKARGLWIALGACLLVLGVEAGITNWAESERAATLTGALLSALVFVVSLLHTRGIERAFDIAARQAAGRDEAARQALEAERRYRLIAESAEDLISLVRSNGEIVYMSDSHERALGLPVALLSTGLLSEHLQIEDLQLVAADFRRAFVDGRGRLELRIHRADGVLRTFDVRMRRVESESDELMAMIGRDVTEQRALEARLQASERVEALGRLAGSVAHDFNNMLTVIRCSTEVGKERIPEEHPSRGDLDAVLRATATATELTQQLLTFSRRQVVVRVPVDVGAVLAEQHAILARLVGPRVRLSCTHDQALPRVVIPKVHVEQLAMNLAANARDSMPKGGHLTIATRLATLEARQVDELGAGDYVELEVRDDGEGIPAEIRPRIFEPLFSTKGDLGTGLGLATCHAIATQAGGAIVVESERGCGATFRVFLPVDRSPLLVEPVARAGRHRHVLVVDDDALVLGMVTRMLRKDGFEVTTAATIAQARQALEDLDRPIDVLLTDVVLGQARGTELFEPCRRARPNVDVVLMSGYAPEPGQADALVREGATFLAKPFGRKQLLDALRR